MTWTLVQQTSGSDFISGNSGTVTVTLPAASTAGTTLAAYLTANSGASNFSGPAGWAQGPYVSNGTGTGSSNCEIWYYPNNPGALSSFVFDTGGSSTNNRAFIAEFNPGTTAAVTLQSSGTVTGGEVSSVTATAGNANTGSVLSLCCFQEQFSTGTAVTWTVPPGYTQAAVSGSSPINNSFAGYELSTAAGTLSVTGQTGTTGVSTTAWSGVIATLAAITAADSAGFTDSVSGLAPAGTDSGGFTDSVSSQGPDVADSAAFADSVLLVNIATTDSVSFTDSASGIAQTEADAAAFTDSVSLTLSAHDSAAFTDKAGGVTVVYNAAMFGTATVTTMSGTASTYTLQGSV